MYEVPGDEQQQVETENRFLKKPLNMIKQCWFKFLHVCQSFSYRLVTLDHVANSGLDEDI